MDGNFKLDHMRMRQLEDNVIFQDGESYMVGSGHYQTHLAVSLEWKQVQGFTRKI